MSAKHLFLCFHGHFYQPPRENPWIEEIELQESALPYHDWNERIYHECYLPNAMARVMDEQGRIVDIVNNYEGISFNFGPTLLSWIETQHPDTYEQIRHADRVSIRKHHGHGNAIAQIYNHMIMPLANERDRLTQAIWGLEDFRQRFGREPEALWLPETACNQETLEVLIDVGMKFLILEPHQAEAVRLLQAGKEGNESWQEVASGQIDPKQPYRCFSRKNPGKFIDVFFYDGPISKDIGFGDLLFDAKKLMDRIDTAKIHTNQDILIHVAADGETYGHHRAFGERALAYALYRQASHRGYTRTNYGEYLAQHPVQYEVKLKAGEDSEGTSWSCAHGVKRWKEHCGCRGEGPAEWHQQWRKPLRQALDWLRDQLAVEFENKGTAYLRDVWQARNDYIRVVLDRSDKSRYQFFERHGARPLSHKEVIDTLKLLEIQRQAMLMYTSCGWFFTEISGIETVQILMYAARAMQLHFEVTGIALEEEFLKLLAKAKSNVPRFRSGKGVYENLVRPRVITWRHLVNYYAMFSTLHDLKVQKKQDLFCYNLHIEHQRKETIGTYTLNFGMVSLTSKITLEERRYAFVAVQLGPFDFRCSLKAADKVPTAQKIESELFHDLESAHVAEMLRRIDEIFGKNYYTLKDLPMEQRLRVVKILGQDTLEKIHQAYEALFDENHRMNEIYRSMNLPLPKEIRDAVADTLERRLYQAILNLATIGFDPRRAMPASRILREAKIFGAAVRTIRIVAFLSEELAQRVDRLCQSPDAALIQECLNIVLLAKKLRLALEIRRSQDRLFFQIKKWRQNPDDMPEAIRREAALFSKLIAALEIHEDIFQSVVGENIK